MKKIIKFSKPIEDVARIKKSLISNNKENLIKNNKINKIYKKQKIRKKCIICEYKIKYTDFISHNIPYNICRKCGHLNGRKLIDKSFNDHIYSSEKGSRFSYKYKSHYVSRVKNIYRPKIKFLNSVLKKKYKILDFGCGAGHLIKSCEDLGINGVGIDPNQELIDLGRKYLKKNQLFKLNFNDCLNYIKESKADVLSLIFVLEHLEKPKEIFDIFLKSKIKYLFISVPLNSFSVFIENVFKDICPRQLGGPHTNLYSKESLNYLIKKYKFKNIGEWWFGSDFNDLYRSILISSNFRTEHYKKKFDEIFLKNIDSFQSILDKEKLCSEIHLILKK